MRMKFSLRTVLFALVVLTISMAMATTSLAQIRISVGFGPPALPVYEQPLCPGDGYLWVPGYWAWDDDYGDYYWVPGTWVLAPEVGFLWTPPYWAWADGGWVFMTVIGGHMSASMAELIMVSAISAMASSADAGTTIAFSTTVQ